MEKQDNIWEGSKRLDFLDTSSDNVTEDMILLYLAQIIADIYLKEEAEKNNPSE